MVDPKTANPGDPIHEVLARLDLTRPLVFLDLETTGLDVEIDQIVELGAVKVRPFGDPDPGQPGAVSTFHAVLKPTIPIKADATAVHGITDADVADAKPFRDVAAMLRASLTGVDVAAYNGRTFDVPMLIAEFRRAGLPWAFDGWIVDPYAIWKLKERRDLDGAVARFAPGYVGAVGSHRAVDDCLKLTAALAGQIRDFWPDAGRADGLGTPTVQALAEAGIDPAWIDAGGKIRWDAAGMPVFAVGKHAGKMVRDLPADYVAWLQQSDFPADVKDLVAAIRKGKIPPRTT